MRQIIRALREPWRRLRFLLWVSRLRLQLRRHGGRLQLEAPHGAVFDRLPAIKTWPMGSASGLTVLRIGRGVRFGRNTTIELWARGDNTLDLGDDVRFLNGARLMLRSGRVSLGKGCLVRDNAVLKSDGALSLGAEVLVSQMSTVHCSEAIEIGAFSTLAERVSLTDSDHAADGSDRHHMTQPLRIDPVRLGQNVLVSAGAVVLRGAEIGANTVVAANSVVRAGSYEAGSLLAGNPAMLIRNLREPGSGP